MKAQTPVQLDRIVVTTQGNRCPVADDPTAHVFWRAMASHYTPAISLLPRTAVVSRDGEYAQGK